MNGEFEINEAYFKGLTPEQRDWLVFSEFNKHRSACEQRFCKLERRKWWDKTVAVISGAITALLVSLGLGVKG